MLKKSRGDPVPVSSEGTPRCSKTMSWEAKVVFRVGGVQKRRSAFSVLERATASKAQDENQFRGELCVVLHGTDFHLELCFFGHHHELYLEGSGNNR